jgi:electron transport complex protein RnfC
LLLERAKDVTEGIRIILHILDAFKCVIAVTEETANAASTLRSVLFDEPNIFLAALPRIYPIGFPHQLMRAVTGAKKLPERGGAVIITPSAAIAVNRAIKEGRPSISRAVNLGGKGISRPQILIARTGTLVSELCGLVTQAGGDISVPIMGGPLSGHMLQTLDAPILPGTDTITFLSKDEYSQHAPKQCLRCGACVRTCPEHLVPALLSVSSQRHDWRNFAKYHPANCAECGCCAYVCPAHRPIVQQIQEGKIAMQRAIK